MKKLIFIALILSYTFLARAEEEKTFTPILKCQTPNVDNSNYVYAEIGQLAPFENEYGDDPAAALGIQISTYTKDGVLTVTLSGPATQPKPTLYTGKNFSLLNTSGNTWVLRFRAGTMRSLPRPGKPPRPPRPVRVAYLQCAKGEGY